MLPWILTIRSSSKAVFFFLLFWGANNELTEKSDVAWPTGSFVEKNSLKKEGVTVGYILRCWPENLLVFLRCVQLSCPFSRYYRNYYSLSYFYPLPCLACRCNSKDKWMGMLIWIKVAMNYYLYSFSETVNSISI